MRNWWFNRVVEQNKYETQAIEKSSRSINNNVNSRSAPFAPRHK